jgi:hypothetical protein
MNTAASSNITPNNDVLATEVLDVTEMLEGFARYERGASRPLGNTLKRLSDDDKHVVKWLLDALLTKKHLQALAR